MNTSKVYFAFSKGLEELCLKEIIHKAELLDITIISTKPVAGGCYLEIDLNDLRSLLPYIKLANSCNLILDTFKCRDLPKLYNKALKVNWGQYLLNASFAVQAHCKKSRLNHEKKVEATLKQAIEDFFKKQAPKKRNEKHKHEVIIYINNDECLLQINLAGEHLHLRNNKKNHKAPLRETYSAAMFFLAFLKTKDIKTVLDPMCGSGSLLLEAANFYKPSKRDFAINKLHNLIYLPPKSVELKMQDEALKLFGNDIDSEAVDFCQSNLSELQNLHLSNFDFLDTSNNTYDPNTGIDLVLCNPPYDERVSWDKKNYFKLADRLNALMPTSICLILPSQKMKILKEKLCYAMREEINFRNGGLPVSICLFTKKST